MCNWPAGDEMSVSKEGGDVDGVKPREAIIANRGVYQRQQKSDR